jgi:hypothetical protein
VTTVRVRTKNLVCYNLRGGVLCFRLRQLRSLHPSRSCCFRSYRIPTGLGRAVSCQAWRFATELAALDFGCSPDEEAGVNCARFLHLFDPAREARLHLLVR